MAMHRFETTMVNLFDASDDDVAAELEKAFMLTGQPALPRADIDGLGGGVSRAYDARNTDGTLIYRLFVHNR